METFKPDNENYEKMSAPFESYEALKKALDGFHASVGKLRKKYRIAEVVVLTQGYYLEEMLNGISEEINKPQIALSSSSTAGEFYYALKLVQSAAETFPTEVIKALGEKLDEASAEIERLKQND